MTTTEPGNTPPSAEALEALAAAVGTAASALAAVLDTWHRFELPADTYTPDTAYPFALSLDEQVAALDEWADVIAQDADVAAGRA